jgi:Helix-turn-helix of DDE superfamily endonuclease
VLNPAQQALLVLVYLRNGETFANLAAGFAISTATAWRYVNETVDLLAARAPRLDHALRKAKTSGHAFVGLDGTRIPIDRLAADRPFYSGKHKHHGSRVAQRSFTPGLRQNGASAEPRRPRQETPGRGRRPGFRHQRQRLVISGLRAH